jgi:hypothetical protein
VAVRRRGAGEIARVLKPRARLALLVWLRDESAGRFDRAAYGLPVERLDDLERSLVANAKVHATRQRDYLVDLLSEGQGRQAMSVREFRPTGTGSNGDIVVEVGAGHAVGFGTPATLASRARHQRLLPFDPPLCIPTYVSWHAQRSPVIDAFVEHMKTLS